jgi:rod shape-determining protein MreC
MTLRRHRYARPNALTRAAVLPAWAAGPAVFVLAALGVLTLSLLRPEAVSALRAQVADLAAPALAAVAAPVADARAALRDVAGIATLQSENTRLSSEVARLAAWHTQAAALEAENARLRALLHAAPDPAQRSITARIVADGGQAFARTLLVHAGAADGVTVGQAALAPGGLAGRVLEVGDGAARVLLVTDVGARVPVVVGADGPQAIVAGTGGPLGALAHLPPDAPAPAPGTVLMTSGHGGLLPPGVPVGRVTGEVDDAGRPRVAFFVDFEAATHLRLVDMVGAQAAARAPMARAVPPLLPMLPE